MGEDEETGELFIDFGERILILQQKGVAKMEVTKAFAAWAAETPEITLDVAMQRARDAIYDVTACMVAGAGDEGAASVRATIVPYGSGPATVFGSTTKAPTP